MKVIRISKNEYISYNEDIVIYGYGRQGKLLYRYLHRVGKRVLCIVDEKKKGIKIRTIKKCIELYPNATFVIAICNGIISQQVEDMLRNVYSVKRTLKCDDLYFLTDLYTLTYKNICTDGIILYEHPIRNDLFSKIKRKGDFFKNIYYKKITRRNNIVTKNKKYNVSLCLIFKDESVYLKEWLEYHLLVGCEHFYLYNNNSSDDYIDVIKPYLDKGYITLITWPHEKMQIEAYIDCFERYRKETNWIGFIDMDEFVVPNHYDSVGDFLNNYVKYGSVFINWKCFGSNGIKCRDLKRLVIEDFTQSHSGYSSNGKCFVNTEFKIHTDMGKYRLIHHKCYVEDKMGNIIPPIDVFGNYIIGSCQNVKSVDFPIQINHYLHKSFDEYIQRMNKSDVYFGKSYRNLELYYENESLMVETEKNIYKYLGKLKNKL